MTFANLLIVVAPGLIWVLGYSVAGAVREARWRRRGEAWARAGGTAMREDPVEAEMREMLAQVALEILRESRR